MWIVHLSLGQVVSVRVKTSGYPTAESGEQSNPNDPRDGGHGSHRCQRHRSGFS